MTMTFTWAIRVLFSPLESHPTEFRSQLVHALADSSEEGLDMPVVARHDLL